jgi:RNA polymerase sigma factor (sigma-70 family)
VGSSANTAYSSTIPALLFFAFQLKFAAITPALIIGAFDRPMSFEIAGGEPTPFDRFANLEDRERIAAALLQLDSIHREVLVLRFHEELSLEEIAKVTRAPLSTVKSRLYRGLAAIKPKLELAPPRSQGVV